MPTMHSEASQLNTSCWTAISVACAQFKLALHPVVVSMVATVFANVDVACLIFAYPASSLCFVCVCCVPIKRSQAHTCNTESRCRYTPFKDCLSARVTCKHADDVFLDPSVQTRVSAFITANDLQSEVYNQVVVAVVVTMLDMPRLVCHF